MVRKDLLPFWNVYPFWALCLRLYHADTTPGSTANLGPNAGDHPAERRRGRRLGFALSGKS